MGGFGKVGLLQKWSCIELHEHEAEQLSGELAAQIQRSKTFYGDINRTKCHAPKTTTEKTICRNYEGRYRHRDAVAHKTPSHSGIVFYT